MNMEDALNEIMQLRYHFGDSMTIDDALSLVKNDRLLLDLNEYRVACRVLSDEVLRLREQIKEEQSKK